ncbi:hypothetical protein GGD83_002280 [Rhodoblastus sphagnicola]|uniref:glycosyltransferase family 87 protein n=1 Tax=Rhodoblastus sphagnicola TaxID=333368 RepID=UPI001304EFDA|nr:glycosyltransferase family 87 protein [Rhodoblastus sphagnicola]MBB4198479.1 hypothetical protein [Rhodoblastus sphagnicola]
MSSSENFIAAPAPKAWRAALRSGDFLTPTRCRAYALILIVFGAALIAALLAMAHGNVSFDGQPLGSDFSQVYVAGLSVHDGAPALAYDNAAHAAHQKAVFGPATPFYSWSYPPVFLIVAALLAFLPYLGALALWQGLGLAAYLALLRNIMPWRRAALYGLAFPAVAISLMHGQNGLITAALMGAGAVLAPARPVLAGVCFGLVAYKPQFGLLIPLALLASNNWRALLAAGATVLAECGAATALFGVDIWRDFLGSLGFSRVVLIEQGGAGWEKMQSVFAAVRALGGSVPLAYAGQGAAALACAAIVVWLYARRADFRLAGAALLTGALLSTPYCMDYDMVLIAPALALLACVILERGALPYEKSIMALAFAAPLLARPLGSVAPIPLGVLAMAALMAAIARRGLAEARSNRPS